MQEYRPGTGNRRRRRRGHHHHHQGGEAPKKKTGLAALVAGIASLFSKKKQAPQEPLRFEQRGPGSGPGRGRGRDRDRDRRRSGGRQEHGDSGAGREPRALREAAEAGHGEAVFKEASGVEHVEDQVRQDQQEHHEHTDERQDSGPAPQAPGEVTEVTTPRLYVGNLSYEASESDLFDLFSQAGGVRNVEIAMDKKTHRSKGFGFVEMESVTVAEAAQRKFHAYHLMGRELIVMGAKSQRSDDRGDRGDRRGGDRGDRRGGRGGDRHRR
jgi:hypothetical protein